MVEIFSLSATRDSSKLCNLYLEVIIVILSLLIDFRSISFLERSLLSHQLCCLFSFLVYLHFGAAKLTLKPKSTSVSLTSVGIVYVLIIVSLTLYLSCHSAFSSIVIDIVSTKHHLLVTANCISPLGWNVSPDLG